MHAMLRILLVFAAALPLFAGSLPSAPAHYVTDAAGVIPDDRESVLDGRLAQHDRDTSNQVLVHVDRKIPDGTTLEEMAPGPSGW